MKRVRLGDIAIFKTGYKPESIFEENDGTRYEYINAGTSNSGYVDGMNCEGMVVTTPSRGQGGIGYIGFQKNPFWLGPLCYKISSKYPSIVDNRYLYYCLSNQKADILSRKKEGGVPALNSADLATIELFVPSLDTQKRIIQILDNFDAICSDLNIGLPAEIEARQKQYEYYRDRLLSFREI